MGALLRARGFGKDDVDVQQHGLTVVKFKERLKQLRTSTLSGDLAVVYISGHGYRRPTSDPREPDGYDECLVLSDDVLADNWFRAEFWPGVAASSFWMTCADTCFSATVLVGIDVFRPPEDDEIVPTPMGVLNAPTYARISLAAAGESQLAQEIRKGGIIEGWYTGGILQAIAATPSLDYDELWKSLDRRWQKERVGYRMLGEPWMTSSEGAQAFVRYPAFAALDYTPGVS